MYPLFYTIATAFIFFLILGALLGGKRLGDTLRRGIKGEVLLYLLWLLLAYLWNNYEGVRRLLLPPDQEVPASPQDPPERLGSLS